MTRLPLVAYLAVLAIVAPTLAITGGFILMAWGLVYFSIGALSLVVSVAFVTWCLGENRHATAAPGNTVDTESLAGEPAAPEFNL
jgi:hypothetical protein